MRLLERHPFTAARSPAVADVHPLRGGPRGRGSTRAPQGPKIEIAYFGQGPLRERAQALADLIWSEERRVRFRALAPHHLAVSLPGQREVLVYANPGTAHLIGTWQPQSDEPNWEHCMGRERAAELLLTAIRDSPLL